MATIEELLSQIGALDAQLKALTKQLEKEELRSKKWWRRVFKVISNPIFLTSLSFALVIFFIGAYFAWKIFGYERLNSIYDNFSYNDGFFWVFFAFIVMCNAPYLKGIIRSIIEEKITSEAKEQIKEKVKDTTDSLEGFYADRNFERNLED